MTYLFVGLGGGLGAMCRYAVSSLPVKTAFPVLTLVVNLLGAFFIGFIVGWLEKKPGASGWLSPFFKTGFCGGFTTFSTFSLEAVTLWQQHRQLLSCAYALLSVLLCVAGVVLGRLLARKVLA